MLNQHIAELNVGWLKHDIFDPRIADFANNLNRINALAERTPGFVWRMKNDYSDNSPSGVFDDPRVIPNLSVWEDVSSLESFVFQTVHKRFYARRAEWFGVMEKMNFVMWPVAIGHQPSLEEAADRLEMLNRCGPTDDAFGWGYAKTAGLWRKERCSGSAA